jgi:predicted DNA-binding protein (MmcQ/YjbR family)
MSSRSTWIKLSTDAVIGFGALFLVGVLLAAIPNHRVAVSSDVSAESAQALQQEQAPAAGTDHSTMPGMNMEDSARKSTEQDAMQDMANMHHGDSLHMHMTESRPQAPGDLQHAEEIAKQLRAGIEKYKDYHVALNEGFKIFHPEIPQPEYHFTNYSNGFLEAFTFDPSRPTSLLYKKTGDGYELVGAMYTMPKRATEEQLNERVPLSIATWHLHTNFCMPPRDQQLSFDHTKFGLRGSIATEQACDAAGGTFHPVIFGWMVHVYPYEDSTEKMFAMHHHMD